MSYDLSIIDDLDILSDLSEIDRFLEELIPDNNMTSIDFIEDVLKGNWVLEPGIFLKYINESISDVIYDWKHLFITILLLFILSAVVGSVIEAFGNSPTATTAGMFFAACQIIVLVNAFNEVKEIVELSLENMLDFMKLIIPAYMICMAASGSGMTALIFNKLILGFVCLVEGILASALINVVWWYVILGTAECIWGEGRFKLLMELIGKSVRFVLKSMIIVLSGSSILQIIITPVIDRTGNIVIQRSVGAIPGIGDIVESVSSVTLASAVAIKNSIGVLILVILALLILSPVIHSMIILMTIRVAGALGAICGERRMTESVDYICEAGFMLVRILITVSTLLFVAIAAITNATSGGI